jgi:hypothetical protein
VGHHITALILPAPGDEEAARRWDVSAERYADICDDLGL